MWGLIELLKARCMVLRQGVMLPGKSVAANLALMHYQWY